MINRAHPIRIALAGAALVLLSLFALPAAAGEDIPFPAELKKDVDFWIRVYTEASTSQGFLHDEHDLSIVYRKLDFARDIQPSARRDVVDEEREKIELMLKRLAAGADNLSDDEKRIREAFGPGATAARFRDAARSVRFQLGQADRFRAGVERSGIWEGHIARTFARLGLPPELAALPHVESSFDPTAYSKVGAAGMWQFMPGTGKRYLRIDDAVDERMDPFRATEAAAQLLDYNYRLLGSWPLALTAYNHGAAGMNRARESMGTTDIATIVRNYKSRSFGFASRNFYVSFLAALTIDRNPQQYFPDLKRRAEMTFVELEMPAYISAAALQKQLGIERDELAALNPALLPTVWSGNQYVPRGYKLRLPADAVQWTSQRVAQSIASQEQFSGQPRPRSYRVRSGDTLSAVAARHGLSTSALAQLNGLSTQAKLRTGQNLKLPREAPDAVAVAARAPEPEKVAETLRQQQAETAVVAKVRERVEEQEPVTVAEARAESPSLGAGVAVAKPAEIIDIQVGKDQTIRVAAEETLGHYADWLGVPASRLRSLNGLTARSAVPLGRRLRLDFSNTTTAEFEARRRAFHETLQAAFFSAHRITGTQTYVARGGDSLWNIAQRHGALPTWLVIHYNPDIDFAALRAGQPIVIPEIDVQQPSA
jgi:membrane-bound lytic murein transglycosylase D